MQFASAPYYDKSPVKGVLSQGIARLSYLIKSEDGMYMATANTINQNAPVVSTVIQPPLHRQISF